MTASVESELRASWGATLRLQDLGLCNMQRAVDWKLKVDRIEFEGGLVQQLLLEAGANLQVHQEP